MNEMTLISMNKYLIEDNHFKYEIIWQNMQEKISNICLQFWSEYPSLGNPPMGGNSASLLTAQWAGSPHDGYSDLNRNIWQILLICNMNIETIKLHLEPCQMLDSMTVMSEIIIECKSGNIYKFHSDKNLAKKLYKKVTYNKF
jgi:hypothetical protein